MNNRKLNTHLSQSDMALKIEALVQAIEHSDTPAFRITHKRSGYERVEETRLSRYFNHVQQMCNLFDDRVPYDYSEHLQAFREACDDIGLQRSPNGPVCMSETGTFWLSHHQSMNVLSDRIRELTRQRWYRRRPGDRRELAKQQTREMKAYSDAVSSLYSRTTITPVWLDEVRYAYLDWYDTQLGQQSASSVLHGRLAARPALRVKRAPGNTCLSALKSGGQGSIERRINQSKGCGGVMRTAPLGFLQDVDWFDLGARAAALTHGHVEGWAPAGILSRIVARLIKGEEKFLAVRNGFSDACEWGHVYGEPAGTEGYQLARKLARKMRFNPHEAIRQLGEGWVGDEALAIAMYAFLSARSYTDAIGRATNHDGDSDSTASIAGQLWGAQHGVSDIPHAWIRRLDVLDEVLLLVQQMQSWRRLVGSDTALEMAKQFARQFPELARAGQGDDWCYAGWLARLLGEVRRGRLPYMLADWPMDLARGVPMTSGDPFPLPPAMDRELELDHNPEDDLSDEELISEGLLEQAESPTEDVDDEPTPDQFDFTDLYGRAHGLVALYHQLIEHVIHAAG